MCSSILEREFRGTIETAIDMMILILILLLMISCYVWGGIDRMRRGYSYWKFFIISVRVKVFDIICLDYLLFKTHFSQHYFPETKGCEGWQDFGYSRRRQKQWSLSGAADHGRFHVVGQFGA